MNTFLSDLMGPIEERKARALEGARGRVEELADVHNLYNTYPTSVGDIFVSSFQNEDEDLKGTNECHGDGFK